ncbi:hypothetical protein [Streptomyces sp. NPDC019937]|uniref:hypothetical protein n=1 Tax=Streptomyces sp. NPDC019937 TaxID=3154787 RepID=UPI0033F2B951
MDAEAVASAVEETLAEVTRGALRGEGLAREELLALADRTTGGGKRLETLWGRMGLGALRGETQRTRRVEWWRRWRCRGGARAAGGDRVPRAPQPQASAAEGDP